jgi:hypothetical protein
MADDQFRAIAGDVMARKGPPAAAGGGPEPAPTDAGGDMGEEGAGVAGGFEIPLDASNIPQLADKQPGDLVEIVGTVRSNENGQLVLDAQVAEDAGMDEGAAAPAAPGPDQFQALVGQRF